MQVQLSNLWNGLKEKTIKPIRRPFMELNLSFIRAELMTLETQTLDDLMFRDQDAYEAAQQLRNELAEEDKRISKYLGIPNFYEEPEKCSPALDNQS